MQTTLFPSRPDPYTGFPNPLLVPVRARNYVRLLDVCYRRDKLTIGQPVEQWWSILPDGLQHEISPAEAERIPAFTRQADMEAYVERLVAFEGRHPGAPSPSDGTHGAGSGKMN